MSTPVTRVYAIALFVGLAVVAVAAITLTSTPASAEDIFHNAKFQFAQQADLVDDITVAVTVRYSCLPPSSPGFLEVEIDQNGFTGDGVATPTCDGANHTTTVMVTGGPFAAG